MVQYRLVKADEMQVAVALADSIFRDPDHTSMGIAFSNVFAGELGQSYGAFEEGKLVSFMGVVPSVICVGNARLHVCSIGSVCTAPDGRGKGYASQLLELVKEHARRAGASLLLVSGDLPIYRKADCRYYGAMEWVRITADALAMRKMESYHSDGVQLRELQPTDWLQLANLAHARAVRFEQSVFDLARLHQAQAVASCYKLVHELFVAQKADGSIGAFAIIAVPGAVRTDTTPFVVEWAGDAELAHRLFTYAMQKHEWNALRIPVMWHQSELASALQGYEAEADRNSGTIHVIDAVRLQQQLMPYRTVRGISEQGWSIEWLADSGCRIDGLKGNAGESLSLTMTELYSLWFDPEAKVVADSSVNSQLSSYFLTPLPYMSGLNFV